LLGREVYGVYRSWRGQVEQADTSAPSLVKAEINRPGEPVDRGLPSLDRSIRFVKVRRWPV
jgi:hypothetical protein